VVGGWRRLHNEKLQNLYASPNIITDQIKDMRWAGHVAHLGEMRSAYKMLVGNLKEGDESKDPVIYEKMVLEWILGKYGGRVWFGFM
jgi:hypothetical protein